MTDQIAVPDAAAIATMTPGEAQAKSTELRSDAGFRGRLLTGAGTPEFKAFQALNSKSNEGDAHLNRIVSGTAPLPDIDVHLGSELTGHNAMQAAADLRERGIDDAIIKQALAGDGVSEAEYSAAVKLKADLLGDSDFVKKWLGGDRAAAQRMTAIHIILANGVKKAAA
jgi:hypothetical protein